MASEKRWANSERESRFGNGRSIRSTPQKVFRMQDAFSRCNLHQYSELLVCVRVGGGGLVSGKWERDVAVCCLRYWTVKYLSYILYVQLPPPLSTSTNDALMV